MLAGLGILDIGVRTAHLIAVHFRSLEKLRAASLAEIFAAPEMGGGLLKDIEKLQERYPTCAALSVEQIMGSATIPKRTEEQLRSEAARRPHEKTPWALIEQLRGRGVAAKSLYDFVRSTAGETVFSELAGLGVKLTEDIEKRDGPQPLAGMTIVVTGTLQQIHARRDQKENRGAGRQNE